MSNLTGKYAKRMEANRGVLALKKTKFYNKIILSKKTNFKSTNNHY